MKKKLLSLTFTFLTLLSSCSITNDSDLIYEDYNQLEEYQITWKDLFSQSNSEYFVYIYSLSCLHCQNIKEEIISFVISEKYPTYLIECTKDIPISNNIEDCIGSSSYVDVVIKGTPSLLQIKNGYLILNIAGSKEILSVLDYYS
ncbi:MAG: hypothetical protein IKB70_09495 [Bacilli bacterium]|nr:hypothetical protein [Bacilli bacterium]